MAYFCTRTGVRIVAPGTVDTAPLHDGSPAADEAEGAVRVFIARSAAKAGIDPDSVPPPDAAMCALAAKHAAEILGKSKPGDDKPKGSDKPKGNPDK